MIHVIAIITAHRGQRDAVMEAAAANLETVRAEAGCIQYVLATDAPGMGPMQSPLGPDSFAVVEKWESQAALMAHAVAPHMAAYARATKTLIATRIIHVLEEAG